MSKDRPRRFRRTGLVLSSTGLLVAAAIAVVPGSSYADPPETVEEARELVDQLNHEAASINERVNDLRVRIDELDDRLEKVSGDIERQEKRVGELRSQIGRFAAAEYRNGGVDTTVQLLAAEDPDDFLAQMSSAQALASRQGHILTQLLAEEKTLAEQQEDQQAALARQRKAKEKAADEQDAAEARVAEAEEVLEQLTEEERQRLEQLEAERAERARIEARASRSGERDSTVEDEADEDSEQEVAESAPASGRGATALAFAESQLGDPYVFGADGPDSYDCSGLTLSAWAEAGVSLPHSAREQYAVSAKIDQSELQPGDLVFFYSDLHHVGIYAGDGQIIHAPRPGKSVEYSSMDVMPYAGAARPG